MGDLVCVKFGGPQKLEPRKTGAGNFQTRHVPLNLRRRAGSKPSVPLNIIRSLRRSKLFVFFSKGVSREDLRVLGGQGRLHAWEGVLVGDHVLTDTGFVQPSQKLIHFKPIVTGCPTKSKEARNLLVVFPTEPIVTGFPTESKAAQFSHGISNQIKS